MTQQINIDEIMRNTRRYWFVDGLVEIMGGGILILVAIGYGFIDKIASETWRMLAMGLLVPAFIIAVSLFAKKGIARFKQRFTYPRTGYLTFKRQHSGGARARRIVLTILVAVTVSAVLAAFSSLIPERWIPAFFALFLSIYTWYLGYYNGVARFNIIAAVTLAAGLFIVWLNLSGMLQVISMLAATGLIWVISGVLAFFSYMKQTKPLAE